MKAKKEPFTLDEALRRLRALEARWPKDVWLFANGTGLHVMRGPHSSIALTEDVITTIHIPSDGGDF